MMFRQPGTICKIVLQILIITVERLFKSFSYDVQTARNDLQNRSTEKNTFEHRLKAVPQTFPDFRHRLKAVLQTFPDFRSVDFLKAVKFESEKNDAPVHDHDRAYNLHRLGWLHRYRLLLSELHSLCYLLLREKQQLPRTECSRFRDCCGS